MQILHFLAQESDTSKERILFMAVVSGGANGLMLAIINLAAAQVSNNQLESRLFIAYLITFLLYVYAQRYAMLEALSAVELILQQVKVRLADKTRRVDLRFIEACGGIGAFSPLTQDTNLIARAALMIVMAAQSLLILLFGGIYLLWLSPTSFFVTLLLIMIIIPSYLMRNRKTKETLQQASHGESEFLARFSDMLAGFKELKMSRRESDAVFEQLRQLSEQTRDLKINANIRMIYDMMFGTAAFYLILLLVVFVLPLFIPSSADEIHKIIATILFIIGPVGLVVNTLPSTLKTETAINNLYTLEAKLDAAIKATPDHPVQPLQQFRQIQLQGVTFSYRDKDERSLFTSGPHHLDIHPGELLFIVGGNGAGKSTFLKLLTGLYPPDSGHIVLDGEPLKPEHYATYRSLYSIVFTDFHLFKRLYGLQDTAEQSIQQWLTVMELDKKTRYQDQRFSNTNLSTGQKKRLAFITAVLKNRPICIFDELAADQDPGFRQRFYTDILPGLQQQGRTVIVVSHDDQFFHVADRILKLEDGKVLTDTTQHGAYHQTGGAA